MKVSFDIDKFIRMLKKIGVEKQKLEIMKKQLKNQKKQIEDRLGRELSSGYSLEERMEKILNGVKNQHITSKIKKELIDESVIIFESIVNGNNNIRRGRITKASLKNKKKNNRTKKTGSKNRKSIKRKNMKKKTQKKLFKLRGGMGPGGFCGDTSNWARAVSTHATAASNWATAANSARDAAFTWATAAAEVSEAQRARAEYAENRAEQAEAALTEANAALAEANAALDEADAVLEVITNGAPEDAFYSYSLGNQDFWTNAPNPSQLGYISPGIGTITNPGNDNICVNSILGFIIFMRIFTIIIRAIFGNSRERRERREQERRQRREQERRAAEAEARAASASSRAAEAEDRARTAEERAAEAKANYERASAELEALRQQPDLIGSRETNQLPELNLNILGTELGNTVPNVENEQELEWNNLMPTGSSPSGGNDPTTTSTPYPGFLHGIPYNEGGSSNSSSSNSEPL